MYMKTTLKLVGVIVLSALLILALFYVSLRLWGDWHDEWSGYNGSTYIGDGYCNIAVLPIMGEVHSYGTIYDEFGNETVSTNLSQAISFLEQAEYEPGIYGVLALVDSTGGSGAAAELIAEQLKNSTLPNAAYIIDSGTSAAYLIASAADTIIASPFSDVGSIGVTMSYLDYSKQNTTEGIEYISLTSGKFKDYGSPDKPLTADERVLFERDLAVWHDEFVNHVATNRNLPVEDVAKLADGSSLPGKLALEAKLVDYLGDKEVAKMWFAEQLDIPVEEVFFCE
jgi:protease IV